VRHAPAQTALPPSATSKAVPELLPEVWSSTPLARGVFLENDRRAKPRDPGAIVQEAAEKSPRSGLSAALWGFHRTPVIRHPRRCCAPPLIWTSLQNWRTTMHVAESLMSLKCASIAGACFSTGSKTR